MAGNEGMCVEGGERKGGGGQSTHGRVPCLLPLLVIFSLQPLGFEEETVLTAFHVLSFLTTLIFLQLAYGLKWYFHDDAILSTIQRYTISSLLPLKKRNLDLFPRDLPNSNIDRSSYSCSVSLILRLARHLSILS